MNWMPEAIRDGIIVVLIISGPLVLAAAFIGLVVGILQAATQVQEQTIGSALKIIGLFVLIIFAGFWMFQYLNQYTTRTFSNAFTVVPNLSQKVIPKGATEKNNTEKAGQFLDIEPPEKIESELPENNLSPATPYLGRPSIPKPPTEVIPSLPPPPPSFAVMPVMPAIQGLELQEPIPIPAMPGDLYDEELDMAEFPAKEFPEINLVPGDSLDTREVNPDLWQRDTEITQSDITNDENKGDELPSWLD